MTGWPSDLANGSAMTRATMSLAPPAAKVTTMRTGFSGQAACAAIAMNSSGATNSERFMGRFSLAID